VVKIISRTAQKDSSWLFTQTKQGKEPRNDFFTSRSDSGLLIVIDERPSTIEEAAQIIQMISSALEFPTIKKMRSQR
jgi:hypothetical protein